MLNRFLKWTIGALAVTVAVVGGLFFWRMSGTSSEAGAEVKGKVTVMAVEVMLGSVTPAAPAYATVTSSPGKSRVLLVQHDGIFKRVNVRDGDVVRTGQPLLTISTAVANEAAYAQAKSALEFAQTELTIVERKFQEKLATNEDVRAKRKALVDAQQALNEQARLGGGAAEETIRAPFDGVISGLMAVAGDKVQANTGFGTISGVTGVVVQLMLDPEDAAKVKPGAEVHMNLPSQGNEQIVGKLSSVGGVVEKDGHLAKAFADVPATAGAGLALGTSFVAHVDLPPREGLVVPRSALLEDETGPYIFIVSNGEAKKENVRPVVETEDMAIIAGFAAPPGTKVIVSGNKDLQDGTPVDAQ